MEFDNIKLVVSEMDGVITDGKFTEDEIGNVLYKTFNQLDFDAINQIKRMGIKFVFMSDDNRINFNACKRRNIPFFWAQNSKEKSTTLGRIFVRYGATPDQTIYIGSKTTDIACLKTVPFSMCPADVNSFVKDICYMQFVKIGGEGVLVDLLDLLNDKAVITDNE